MSVSGGGSGSSPLVESYEQQYAVLTAEITAHIGTLKQAKATDERKQLIINLDNHFEEANDLLEQLEIEVRGTGQSHLVNRLACYRAELSRIKTEFESAKHSNKTGAGYSGDNIEYYDEWNVSQEQKAKLLDNSDRIEITGKKLTEGYSVLLETEQIGATVLNDLNLQRETIQRSRNRLRETDEQLGRSSRILSSMIFRSVQQKFVLFAFGGIFILILCVALYVSFK